MSDYEQIAERIKQDGYVPEYGMENLILNVFAYYDVAYLDEEVEEYTLDGCVQYVYDSGGWEMFDYEP